MDYEAFYDGYRLKVETHIRTIYNEIERTENDAGFEKLRFLYNNFIFKLTFKIRTLIKESRKGLKEITNEYSKEAYINWHVERLTVFFMNCMIQRKIVEFDWDG